MILDVIKINYTSFVIFFFTVPSNFDELNTNAVTKMPLLLYGQNLKSFCKKILGTARLLLITSEASFGKIFNIN